MVGRNILKINCLKSQFHENARALAALFIWECFFTTLTIQSLVYLFTYLFTYLFIYFLFIYYLNFILC